MRKFQKKQVKEFFNDFFQKNEENLEKTQNL